MAAKQVLAVISLSPRKTRAIMVLIVLRKWLCFLIVPSTSRVSKNMEFFLTVITKI